MKIKSAILGLCIGLCSSVFAANLPNMEGPRAPAKNASYPGYCEIEIANNSFDNVRVYGVFDDGTSLSPFNIYTFESPYYISLYYYGYCHAGMYLYIDTFSGYRIYAGYTETGTTLRVSYLANKLKAEKSRK